MKIGILTFHRAENFGAVLQAYSLQEYLKSSGHTVEFIDYRNKAVERQYDLFDLSFLIQRKNILRSLWILFVRIFTFHIQLRKKDKYAEFRNNYLHISKKIYNSIDDFNDDYEIYICGSDQIWNPIITDGFDMVYFLNFRVNRSCKRIVYAASSESYAYNTYQEKCNVLISCFKNLDAISVREDSLAVELNKLTSQKIEIVLDPVFLSDKSFYLSILKDPCIRNYVLVYHLSESRIASKTARRVAKDKNTGVIEIHAGFGLFINDKEHKQDLSPLELLGYIYYADMVFTTSFHGMLFSLIFNKDFYVINKGSITRQKDLLKKLNLEYRVIDSENRLNEVMPVDYTSVNKQLLFYIEKSRIYLDNNIKA